MGFGPYLRDLCDDLGSTFGIPNGPQLTSAIADCPLPIGTAVALGLVADLLITNAFQYAFAPGSGGRIAVSFTTAPECWRLAVEDNGIATPVEGDGRDNGLMIARLLVLRLGGRLAIAEVTGGGSRYLVSVPRAPSLLDGVLSPAAGFPTNPG